MPAPKIVLLPVTVVKVDPLLVTTPDSATVETAVAPDSDEKIVDTPTVDRTVVPPLTIPVTEVTVEIGTRPPTTPDPLAVVVTVPDAEVTVVVAVVPEDSEVPPVPVARLPVAVAVAVLPEDVPAATATP